jgi:hypothetical protein
MKIEDNFLKQEDFDKLQKFIMKDIRHQKGLMQASPFPWFYDDTIDYPRRKIKAMDNFYILCKHE